MLDILDNICYYNTCFFEGGKIGMKKLILILLLVPLPVFAYEDIKVSSVVSVYDGDTIKVNISGYPDIIGKAVSIRVKGIDTPEMRDKRPKIKKLAKKARQFVLSRVRSAKVIELKNVKRGKYFRIVADVYINGVNLGDELIKAGLAKRYGGKKKAKW
jgi:endonuclease YncB( thermonuclease family)